jgi:hypothetical protein
MQIKLRPKQKKIKEKDDKWHLWFAWHPVIISAFGLSDVYPNNEGIRVFVWLDFVQRKYVKEYFNSIEQQLEYGKKFIGHYEYMLPQISH